MLRTINILSTKLLREGAFKVAPYSGAVLEEYSFVRIDLNENIRLPAAQKVAAIVTSANAVKALERLINQLPVFDTIYCIAGKTEALVKEHLKPGNIIARPYASELLEVMINTQHTCPLWFFKGNKVLPTIPEGLQNAGIAFEAIEVYQNTATPVVLGIDFDAILFFSPSAVESFLQNNYIHDNTITFAIGKTTAKALKPFAKKVVISKEPTEESVIKAVREYFNL